MERIEDLQRDGLKIIQDTDKFMFGTDSVLLANFAKIKKNQKVLDIGTGTGIITFLMYGRHKNANYTAIDIQEEMIEMANRSKALNGIENIEFIHTDLKDFDKKEYFDVVVCNPPYEKLGTGFTNGNDAILQSRYEISATLQDIIACAKNSLKSNGKLFMIYKAERIAELANVLTSANLELKGIQPIVKNAVTPPRLILIEAIKGGHLGVKWHEPIIMYDENGQLTNQVRSIYNAG